MPDGVVVAYFMEEMSKLRAPPMFITQKSGPL